MKIDAGTRIGDYEVLGMAGIGGMGAVYRVRNLLSDRVDALKVVSDLDSTPGLAERFLREIRLQARLRHPNIASLYTAFTHDQRVMMVMEFVEGATLDAHLLRGPLEPAAAADCMAQVLAALDYAHGHGVVHRDIKPGNIALMPDGTVKLLDFGIARDARDLSLTVSGMAVGSLYYMAPEQLTASAVDGRADVYAVGITLYEAITGRRAVAGETSYAVMQAQLQAMPVPPAQVNPNVPPALSDMVMRAIAKRADDRFQTAAEFRAQLLAFRDGAPIPAPPPAASTGGAFPPETLAKLERSLAPLLGPIARHVVRSAARGTAALPELCRKLSLELPTDAGRKAFFRACAADFGADALSDTARRQMATTVMTPGAPGATASRWDPATLERARTALAVHVGPVARVLVDRAARSATSIDELYATLGAEIDSETGRRQFLAARPQGAAT